MAFTWGAACRPKQGQTVSGDVYVVLEQQNQILATVIDGLGGGSEAAHAALKAEEVIRQYSDRPLKDIIHMAHTALHHTRGAVIGVMRLEQENRQATYIGVGNIGVQVYSQRSIKPISKNGILGFRLPTLLELTYTYDLNDTFILFSDGISSRFAQDRQLDLKPSPQQIANIIMQGYGKAIDDATVVVMRT